MVRLELEDELARSLLQFLVHSPGLPWLVSNPMIVQIGTQFREREIKGNGADVQPNLAVGADGQLPG